VLPGEVIAPIDMGMMGSLEPEMIDALLELLVGILLRDAEKIARLFARLGLIDEASTACGCAATSPRARALCALPIARSTSPR